MLNDSEAKYRTLFDSIDEGFCIIEFFDGPHGPLSDYIHTDANAAYARHAGIPNVVGQTLRKMVPDEADDWIARYRPVLETGRPIRFQQDLIATGRRLELAAFRIEPPERRQVAVLFTDVTDRWRAENNTRFLVELDAELNRLTDAPGIEQATVNRLGSYLRLDHCFFAQIDEVNGVIARDFSAGGPSLTGEYAVADFFTQEVVDVLRSGQPFITDDIAGDPHMSSHAANYRAIGVASFLTVPIIYDEGWVACLSLVSRTPRRWRSDEQELARAVAGRVWPQIERARTAAALNDARQRFDIVKHASQVGFWFCDLPFDKLIWDDRVKEHFWLPPDADVTIDTFYQQLHPDDRERTRLAIEESIASHNRYDIDYRTCSSTGESKWIRAIGRTFYNAQGAPVRFDGVTLDVTEPRRAEERLREADRRKDEFLAMLSHELRNPLAPIRNAAQVLKLTTAGDDSHRWARDVIERQTQHMTRLVDDLLDMSRITQGKVTLQREPIALGTVAARAVEANRPLVDARRQNLIVTVPADHERPLRVDGDPTRLVQIVSNLLNNAAKYTDEGGSIWLEIARDGDDALIRVRDNGVGMTADLVPQVFDLFTQADHSLDRSQSGLGIGLTLVKRLVEMHGGTVTAASDGPGRGSEFVVRLPALATPPAGAESDARLTRHSSSALRILIVEDNEDAAESMAIILRLHGHEVRTAHDGEQGLEAARAFAPQIVMADIGLPGMDGYEIARRLRADPPGPHTRLIAISGYGRDEDRRRSREAGFDEHLVKPVDPQALTDMLHAGRT